MKKTWLVMGVIVLIIAAAAGCGPKVKDDTAYKAPHDKTSSTSTGGNKENTGQPAGNTVVTPVLKPDSPSATDRSLIQDLVVAARQGKVPGCDFAAGKTNYEPTVTDLWGKADSVKDLFPKGRYVVYGSRRITLGVNKGELLFEVRSFDPKYKELTRADITAVLGNPDSLRYYKDSNVQQDILVYDVSRDYQISFVLPQANKTNPDPHVDHICVVSPKDAVNLMAE